MNKNLTVIGAGNMGTAIIKGILSKQVISPNYVTATTHNDAKIKEISKIYPINVFTDNKIACQNAQIVILAVKPYILPGVIEEIKSILPKETLILSIVTGYTLQDAENDLGKDVHFARIMPNLAAQVGESMSGIVPNANLNSDHLDDIVTLFNAIGQTAIISEAQLDTVTGLSGSSPTLVFMMIEAMADAGVRHGLPREEALQFATQAIKGAATFASESTLHPEALKDQVCTPSGTSIEVVREAEKQHFRSAVQEAIIAGIEKAHQLSIDKESH